MGESSDDLAVGEKVHSSSLLLALFSSNVGDQGSQRSLFAIFHLATTFVEIILNQELGEPFRRDAMKKPVEIAGIKKEDMKPQPSENN